MSFISKRLESFDTLKIRSAFELGSQTPGAIDLSIGFPEDDTPDHIKAAGIAAIKNNHTRYTASDGLPALKQAIAEKISRENDIKTSPGQVSVTPGLTTAILLTYLSTLDSGDEILIPEPYFPPYKDLALMLGIKPVLVDTTPSFQLTADLLKHFITPKTKAIIVNSPNNPSGAVYPKKELIKIAALAKRHNLLIISDEVYEHFNYDGKHFSIGSVYPLTLTLNGFSKSYSMTGWRIGYIRGPEDIIEAINVVQQCVVFSSSSIGQHAALAAVGQSPKNVTKKYRSKRDMAKKLLGPIFTDIKGGQGAFYLFLKLPAGVRDMDLVNTLAEHGVIVLPGSAFSHHQNYIRISYGGNTNELRTGLGLLGELVKNL